MQAVAPSLKVELNPVDVRDVGEIERAIAAFTRGSDGGMIVTASLQAQIHRTLIIALAAQHRLPAVYPYRFYVGGGGTVLVRPTCSAARPATSIASSRCYGAAAGSIYPSLH